MNESEFTRVGLASLRLLPEAEVIKHADRFTAGVPDISVTTRGKTTWLELKAVSKGESPIARVSEDQLQLRRMQRLAAFGRAVYVILDDGELTLWHPEYLVRRIITDKKFAWSREMYVVGNPDSVGDIEAIVKNVKKDPILFPGKLNVRILVTLVEV